MSSVTVTHTKPIVTTPEEIRTHFTLTRSVESIATATLTVSNVHPWEIIPYADPAAPHSPRDAALFPLTEEEEATLDELFPGGNTIDLQEFCELAANAHESSLCQQAEGENRELDTTCAAAKFYLALCELQATGLRDQSDVEKDQPDSTQAPIAQNLVLETTAAEVTPASLLDTATTSVDLQAAVVTPAEDLVDSPFSTPISTPLSPNLGYVEKYKPLHAPHNVLSNLKGSFTATRTTQTSSTTITTTEPTDTTLPTDSAGAKVIGLTKVAVSLMAIITTLTNLAL